MKKSVKHPRRQELPANLPRVEWILPCTPDQRVCRRCVKETVVIGYEEKLPAYSEIFLLCGAATALTFFIADLLFLCALSASKTWERTLETGLLIPSDYGTLGRDRGYHGDGLRVWRLFSDVER
jgi:hypothetical protein